MNNLTPDTKAVVLALVEAAAEAYIDGETLVTATFGQTARRILLSLNRQGFVVERADALPEAESDDLASATEVLARLAPNP
jgi:hypothetical protein